MTPAKKIILHFIVPVFVLYFSCSARIDGVVREGGAAELALKASLQPRTIAIIRSLQGFIGEATDEPILDGPEISRSLSASPGVRAVSLKNIDLSTLEGSISISNVGDFLTVAAAAGDSKVRFITYTEGRSAGTSSLIATLDRNTAPELISRLSPEAEEYLSALMAPVVLGETSTRQEYLDLLALVYGRSLADEIAGARIRAVIEFPRSLASVKGGTSAGNKAEFDISLVDLLVLEYPQQYEITW